MTVIYTKLIFSFENRVLNHFLSLHGLTPRMTFIVSSTEIWFFNNEFIFKNDKNSDALYFFFCIPFCGFDLFSYFFLTIFLFISVSFCFVHFGALMLGEYMLIIVILNFPFLPW